MVHAEHSFELVCGWKVAIADNLLCACTLVPMMNWYVRGRVKFSHDDFPRPTSGFLAQIHLRCRALNVGKQRGQVVISFWHLNCLGR